MFTEENIEGVEFTCPAEKNRVIYKIGEKIGTERLVTWPQSSGATISIKNLVDNLNNKIYLAVEKHYSIF